MTSPAARPRPQGRIALPGLAAEPRFVFAAARMVGEGGDPAQLREAAGGVRDWDIALRGLRRHGLIALAAPLLKRERVIPGDFLAVLEAQQGDHAVAALMRIREASRIVRALEAAGIRYLVIKGLALSIQLYGDPALRGGRDIDIWIEPGRMADAETILGQLGYVLPVNALPKGPEGLAPPKESGWVHAESRMLVELHDRLTDNPALLPWAFEEIWEERETVTIAGHAVPTMPRRRLPLYLAVHGVRHGWQRLMWLEDLAAVLDARDGFDRAMADAAKQGLEGMMLHVCWALHHWLARPVPGDLLARAAWRIDTRLINLFAARFHGGRYWYEDAPRHSLSRFLAGSLWSRGITYAMRPSARFWRRQLAWDLDSPHDRALFGLSPRAAWLYPLLRPAGWIIRRLRR
ncbi:nucleotidyltransferase family protein [Sphingomonas sp. LB-2]|uniref:nucleotidyltransferase domain-containing protein n=1 Tax=Sphingomonas caeni TaxID=2984949 RepID=UPI0022317064|nr:nucleotidyltransferase family protein [Sphingomonas caeni]MCW3846650.1 nucleotidyltransferase family protein [Sphingomonas caeni]